MPDVRKTTGTRNPTRGQFTKPGVKYPTPDPTNDFLIVERTTRDSKEPPIAYGTAHPKISAAKLIDQSFDAEEDNAKTRVRVYAAYGTPAQQDVYNAALSYSGESKAHRILVRSYTLPRGYTVPDKGTPDTAVATAVLVKEDSQPIEGDAVNVRVIRIFEELPGPWLPFTRYDDDLGPVQGRRRAVLNTGQVPSLTATSRKTYESRDGSSIVSWEIEEVYSNGTGSEGNPAFPIRVEDIHDPQLGPVQRTTQIVVKTGSEAGSINVTDSTFTETEYEPYNEFLLRRVVEVMTLPGPARSGQNYDPSLDVVFPFTKQVMKAADAANEEFADVDPLDALRAEVTKIARETAQNKLEELHFQFAGQESIRLPDKLVSAEMLWSLSEGVGSSTSGDVGTPSVSTTFTRSKSHQSSGAVSGNLTYEISHGFDDEVPSIIHIFYLPLTGVTTAAILAKVGASSWPTVRKQSHRIGVSGGSKSRRESESRTIAYGWNGTTYVPVTVAASNSTDYDVSASSGSETIPPTIHPAIAIGNPTVTGAEGTSGSITPTTLPATSPAVFPTGRFLRRSDARPFQFGYAQITAVTVDITSAHVG